MDLKISIDLMLNRNKKIRIFGEKFVENNKSLEINIDGKKNSITTGYKLENDEINMLTIEFNYNNISDISHMFEGCKDFETINIDWPDTSKIININYMFKNCKNLKNIKGLSNWNTENIKSMIGLFYGCSSLEYIYDISEWNTSNLIEINKLFYGY